MLHGPAGSVCFDHADTAANTPPSPRRSRSHQRDPDLAPLPLRQVPQPARPPRRVPGSACIASGATPQPGSAAGRRGLGSGYGQKVVTSRAELKTDPVQKGSPLWTAAAIRYPVEIIYLASDHRRIHFWTPCGGGRRRRRWHSQWSRGFEGSLPFGTGLFGAPGPRDHFLHVS
jgi:hypothetical protein